MMQMYLYTGCNATFLFKAWETKQGECGKFLLGVVGVVALTLLVDILPHIRKMLKSQSSSEKLKTLVSLSIWEIFYVFGNFLIMLLLMTFNVNIFFAVIASKLLVYSLFQLRSEISFIDKSS